jgi:hypothetical protein
MDDRKLQYFMSLISPPIGRRALSAYFKAIGRGVDHQTDAALARMLGVTAATLANWKRRGSVPQDWSVGIVTALVEKIATFNREMPRVSHPAREATIALMALTRCDPLQAGSAAIIVTAQALPGLLALAETIIELRAIRGEDGRPEEIARLMQVAMPQFRRGAQFRALP